MELLEATYTATTFALLSALGVALCLARLITRLERRLITGAAVLFSGIFFLARPAPDPTLTIVGAASWMVGLAIFLRAGLVWQRSQATRFGPIAAFFLLPPAFFGAVLVGGLLTSVLEKPAQLTLRLVGG